MLLGILIILSLILIIKVIYLIIFFQLLTLVDRKIDKVSGKIKVKDVENER